MKKKKRNPPKKYNIDPHKVEVLSRIGCSIREVAEVFGCSEDLISASYSEFYTKGRENLKERLRKKQISVALHGNVTMLIWLGKQYLEQKEKTEIGGQNGEPIFVKATVEIIPPKTA